MAARPATNFCKLISYVKIYRYIHNFIGEILVLNLRVHVLYKNVQNVNESDFGPFRIILDNFKLLDQ